MMMTQEFTAARKEQGFRSQADLDAFFAYHDHTEDCAECHLPGTSVFIDNGFQPTQHRCAAAKELWHMWCEVHDAA
jgi:hypothetical protein